MSGTQRIMRGKTKSYRTAYFGDLMNNGYVFHITQSGSTVLFGHQYPHETQLSHFSENLLREHLLLIPLHELGLDALFGKIPCGDPHMLGDFGKLKIHRSE